MFTAVQQTVALLLILSSVYVECKNVVFLPLWVSSHARAHAFVAEELAKMNHKVWLAVPSALDKRSTESYPGVTTFRYNDFWEMSEDMIISDLEATVNTAIETGSEPDFAWVWESIEVISGIYFKAMMEGKFTQYIESLHPDLIVLDWNPYVDERVALSYKLKVPFAVLSPLQDPISGKVPFNPIAEAYNSAYFRTKANFLEQVIMVTKIMSPLFMHIFNDRGYMKQLFPTDPNVPPANELMSQAEVYIVESDPISDYPRPTVPNVKLVGGLSISTSKSIQEPFKSFLERSEKSGVGVAVLSFGSLFMNIPKEFEAKLVTALRRLSVNTIWRANVTSPDPNKILTSTWLPQNDLLAHKNVKVFISHSGAHSLYESLYHAVPTVCLPLFFDQQFNADRAEDKGYCLSLDVFKASADDLVRVIEQVVSSKEMKAKVSTASEIYRQLYKNPRQEAAFWLDHVMRYGGEYMRYSGQKIPMTLFIMDYVLVFITGVVFTLAFLIIVLTVKKVLCFCFKTKRHLKNE
ncbi:hypothetical protein BsWGS_13372 [Bradybaena similaris]